MIIAFESKDKTRNRKSRILRIYIIRLHLNAQLSIDLYSMNQIFLVKDEPSVVTTASLEINKFYQNVK